ncbi:MAG TPA: YfhO family protein [Thermoanaerobaculia bacterium]|nr:YfhO family protein [Thermoanaerobaculia bacterium]
MNPALPILLALSLAGLLVWRRGPRWDLGLPWAACGLAAMALLAPALAIPDGVPGPAASLGQHVPWRDLPDPALATALDPAKGNPHLRDVVQQVYPWLLFTHRELRAGRLPFWNPHQFSGTPFWSNGSSAPLFPFHLLFAALPVQLGLVLLPWLRLVVGGCGAWALARELGTGRSGALVAALAFPLSGMVTAFVLFPMANAHALVPWVLLATERLAGGRWGWAPLGLLGGLQVAAGHPETAVFTGLLTLVYLAVRGAVPGRALATWVRFAGAWVAALAVSAIHIVPLAFTLVRSSKWLESHVAEAVPLPVLGSLALRFVLPELHGNPALGTWWGPYNYPATAVYAGAAALPLAAAGLWRLSRDRRWLAVAALTLFALLAAYQAPGLRHLFFELPVLQKSLPHYFKFGVELGLGLLAARGVDRLQAGEGRRLVVAGTAIVLAALVAAWIAFTGTWREQGLLGTQAAWTAGVAAAALLVAVAARLQPPARRRIVLALPAVLAADLILAHAPTNRALPAAALYPETGAVRFLAARAGGDPGLGSDRFAGVGTALQPNAALVYGLHDVRGDTPVKLHHYQEVYGSFASPHPVYFRPIEDWQSPWLDRLSVRWVVGPPGARAPVPGWRLAHDGDDARVWERRSALPLVRWAEGAPAGGRLEVLERSPGRWLIARETAPFRGRPRGATPIEEPPRGATPIEEPSRGATLLVVAETWDPGWRARVDGEPAPVEAVDGVLLGVRVKGGAGRLVLEYRPEGFGWGVALSVLGLGACGLGLLTGRRRSP